ncbi:MAG: hypothetical protein IKC75_00440 [Clostridia bacterium]|nr:hypothetical protein [Clostridia bacterium]
MAQDGEHSDWGLSPVTAMAVAADLHRPFLTPASTLAVARCQILTRAELRFIHLYGLIVAF